MDLIKNDIRLKVKEHSIAKYQFKMFGNIHLIINYIENKRHLPFLPFFP